MRYLQKWIPWALLGTIIFIAFWIRIQGVASIPYEQFTGNDPYLYYWQAQIISEQGHLPPRDMHRWLPLGRDLGQSLNAYSYALAYAHRAIVLLFPDVSLYHTALFAPVVCFVIGLGVLCFFSIAHLEFYFQGSLAFFWQLFPALLTGVVLDLVIGIVGVFSLVYWPSQPILHH